MTTLNDLLRKGYFPEELPPPFTTKTYAGVLVEQYSALSLPFTQPTRAGKISPHNRPRVGSLRRTLGIPNPIHYFRLADEVSKHGKALEKHYKRSKISLSVPVARKYGGRAIAARYRMSALPGRRAANRATSRYIVKADIARFYHSIYTHTIPWALHSKATAKSRPLDKKLLGNRFDIYVRSGQDNQTIGIPIGPDTSLALAECILCEIDACLPASLRNSGFRYIDDYEFGFSSLSQAEEGLAILQEKLSDYELALNPRKTRIVELPSALEDAWVSELRVLTIHDDVDPKAQRYDLLRYFDRAFELAKQYQDEHVLNYAIQRVSGILIAKTNWSIYQDLMLQCVLSEPGTLRYGFGQLTRYKQMGYKLDADSLRKVVNVLVEVHSRQGHGSEVAWAVWAAIFFNVSISTANGNRIAKMDDSVVALLSLDARSKGLIPKSVKFDYWKTLMTTEGLYDKHWLLAYEAGVKKWLPSAGKGNHIDKDPAFKFLKTNNVQFYNDAAALRIHKKSLPPKGGFLALSTVFMQY